MFLGQLRKAAYKRTIASAGGKARAKALTAEQRRVSATKASKAAAKARSKRAEGEAKEEGLENGAQLSAQWLPLRPISSHLRRIESALKY